MKRLTKFRALKDQMNPVWVYGNLIYDAKGNPRIQHESTDLFTTCLKHTEGEFTGLYDRSMKELYEDDIVKFRGAIYGDGELAPNYESEYEITAKIIFMPSRGFCLKFLKKVDVETNEEIKMDYKIGFITQSRVIKIGNIHDNKDLLNEL
jgi:uncharacterized phage protein (TIGR01671 family)